MVASLVAEQAIGARASTEACSQALGCRKKVILTPPVSLEAGDKLPLGEGDSLQPVCQGVEVAPSHCPLGEPWRPRPVGQSFRQAGGYLGGVCLLESVPSILLLITWLLW